MATKSSDVPLRPADGNDMSIITEEKKIDKRWVFLESGNCVCEEAEFLRISNAHPRDFTK